MSCCSPVHRQPGRPRAALWLALALWLLTLLPGPAAAGPTCHGRFMNPITDICWSCLFPLTIGSASILSDGQPDIGNPSSPVCYCSNPPRIGVSIGFLEPVRMVDVTRTPFCMVGLGGIALDPGLDVPRGAHVGHDSQTRNSFYHAHWYANPILTWLEVLLDFPCLEKGSLDLAYLTEVDPLWADDELTAILNPEAVLFANPPAKAACAADCVAATAGMPIASLFWCAGCQGSIYPMGGHVATHIGGVQASTLITQRMTAKMHRQLVTFNVDTLTGVFNAIAAIMGGADYFGLIKAIAITGVLVAAFAGLFTPGKFHGWGWLMGFLLVYYALFLPKSTVVIVDKLGSQPPVAVGNVPIGVAFFGHATSKVAVPGPGSDGPAEHAPAQPRHPRRRRRSQDRQARVDAHAAPFLCHPPAGAEGRHPRDPGPARPRQAGDHQHLHARRHRPVARGDQPAGEPAALIGRLPWADLPWRSPTSSAFMAPPGVPPSVAI